MVKALVFDWHGVLDMTTFRDMANILIEGSYQELNQLGNQYASGELSHEAFWEVIRSRYDNADEAKEYILQVQKNEDLWKVIPALAEKYTLAILSDCPSDKADVIRRTEDLSLFQSVIFSYESSLTKKNPEFFETIKNELSLDGEDIIFIDDSETNIGRAQNSGLSTILYVGQDLSYLIS